MDVQELINLLLQIEDKTLPVRLITTFNKDDDPNMWLNDLEVFGKGHSGYEVEGEVLLLGSE